MSRSCFFHPKTPILPNQYAPRHVESMRCTTFTTSSNRPIVSFLQTFSLGPVTTPRHDVATTDGARYFLRRCYFFAQACQQEEPKSEPRRQLARTWCRSPGGRPQRKIDIWRPPKGREKKNEASQQCQKTHFNRNFFGVVLLRVQVATVVMTWGGVPLEMFEELRNAA